MKEKIREVAAHLFATQGYKATSMQQIADACGVTKAALYYHYTGKDELFLDIISETCSELITLHRRYAESKLPVWEVLDEWVGKMINFFEMKKDQWIIIHKFLGESVKNKIFNIFRQFWKESFKSMNTVLSRGMQEGDIRTDIDVRLLTASIFGIMQGQFTTNVWEDIKINDVHLKMNVQKVLKGGIASDAVKKDF
ncbi:MAG: TetR/AcrR family transcriptional regulator [Candidatus Marinimicrobia bacterium]|nr:TetR/AcrR family transcriptional regulator [Candidatus Neomarinimicrobiota bacterium]